MDSSKRSNFTLGIILVLVGMAFLAYQLAPGVQSWLGGRLTWPLIIIGVGALLLIMAALTRQPAMLIPACVVGGVGAILYWQNMTQNFTSWAYAWALIPGFAGMGMLLSGLFGSQQPGAARKGLELIFTSALLFIVFGSFMGAFALIGRYWPLLLVAAGLLLLVRGLFSGRKTV